MSRGGRPWRRLRAAVLQRDGYVCQRWVYRGNDLVLCGRPATDCGHIVPEVYGGLAVLTNLRAECAACNRGDGARIAQQRRRRGEVKR